MQFKLISSYEASGDQPKAIHRLVEGIQGGLNEQVLLGVTGSGKTFTMASVVARFQKPTLVISHNKTLAAQLYQEFKSFFPHNAVSYFVSYYDYYQPEAYIPTTDTYIDKETEINEELDKLRLAATTNLLTRPDSLIVASVSCIYNIGSSKEYEQGVVELRNGLKVARESIFSRLIDLQYQRSDYGFHRGSFRVRGEVIDIFPAYEDSAVRVRYDSDTIGTIERIDPVSGSVVETLETTFIYPAKHYIADTRNQKEIFKMIKEDLTQRVAFLKKIGKIVEAQRLQQRVTYDLEMIEQMGYVNGIENYSRYFDGRLPGAAPYTLLEYYEAKYGNEWLLFIDESHMTVPQIRGMYQGDRSRKETLIEYGFRLPAALDNRPLKFDEFLQRLPTTIYVSATPDEWELHRVQSSVVSRQASEKNAKHQGIVEQLVRPTGLLDPEVEIRPVTGQIPDLIKEIEKRIVVGERVLVTTLTKRMAEDLSKFLEERHIKVHYLHSDIETLERTDILEELRRGTYDVVVGINLLREGLDLPEVSLVAILDADKEGFLRSTTSLIQTMGRAARHVSGRVIMYADKVTGSMQRALDEVMRRRKAQLAYNRKHTITPASITKPIREKLVEDDQSSERNKVFSGKKQMLFSDLPEIEIDSLTPFDIKKLIKNLTRQMKFYARDLNFEAAAHIRDKIKELKND